MICEQNERVSPIEIAKFRNTRFARSTQYDIQVYHGGIDMLAIRISHDIENRLQQLALRTGRTKTYYAREALLRFIEDMEDEYLALSRLETPTKRWTLEELEKAIDLES